MEVFLEVASHLKEMFSMLPLTVLGHKKHDCSKLEYVFILGMFFSETLYTHISTSMRIEDGFNHIVEKTPTKRRTDF